MEWIMLSQIQCRGPGFDPQLRCPKARHWSKLGRKFAPIAGFKPTTWVLRNTSRAPRSTNWAKTWSIHHTGSLQVHHHFCSPKALYILKITIDITLFKSRGARFDPQPWCPKAKHHFCSQNALYIYIMTLYVQHLFSWHNHLSPTTDSHGKIIS